MWKVWVFLAPLCPICQDYTFYLNALHEQWQAEASEELEMVGWFPNPAVTDEAIDEFANRYGVEWKLARDTIGWSEAVGARYTPEAVLISPSGEVVYRGRVNDLYYALGKHRSKPRNSDLALAVDQALAGEEVLPATTEAIGCPIENRLPFNDSLARCVFADGLRGL
ncbi:MAG: hypothetical protein ACO3MV_04035 [Flavobacteriales bacterium]